MDLAAPLPCLQVAAVRWHAGPAPLQPVPVGAWMPLKVHSQPTRMLRILYIA